MLLVKARAVLREIKHSNWDILVAQKKFAENIKMLSIEMKH